MAKKTTTKSTDAPEKVWVLLQLDYNWPETSDYCDDWSTSVVSVSRSKPAIPDDEWRGRKYGLVERELKP